MKKEELEKLIGDRVGDAVKQAVEPLTQRSDQSKDRTDFILGADGATIRKNAEPERGIGASRMVRCLAMSKGDPSRAERVAKKFLDENWRDECGERVHKALQAGDLSTGGFMVEPEFANEIIEFLYNNAVVRQAGPRVLPMNNGSLTIPRQNASASASFVGENQDIAESEPGGEQLELMAKKLAALVPVTNDLLSFAAGNQADMFVRDDLVQRIAVREDTAFLRGDGTQNTPRGFTSWAQSANVTNSNGDTADNIESDFREMFTDLQSNNVSTTSAAWFMSPRTFNTLMTTRDGSGGQLIFPEIRNPSPTIFGRPVFTTTNIPTNLGTGSDETEIYLVNMNDVIIGEDGGLEIEVSTDGSFHDGSDVVSAFERDLTLVRALLKLDMVVRHPESIAVKQQVTYGT